MIIEEVQIMEEQEIIIKKNNDFELKDIFTPLSLNITDIFCFSRQ